MLRASGSSVTLATATTPRLPKAGLLPDDPTLIARIVAAK
jgi:hypothetical protein